MSEKSVVDLVRDSVLPKLEAEARAQVDRIAAQVLSDVQKRAAAAVEAAAAEAVAVAQSAVAAGVGEAVAQPIRNDAKNRAWRTAVQGLIATVVVSVLVALSALASGGGLDLFSSEGWKVVIGTVSGAAIMAVSSYVQRVVNPPKE